MHCEDTHMTEIISSQLHFILFFLKMKQKKERKKTTQPPAAMPFLRTLHFFSHFLFRHFLRQTALKTRRTKPLGMCTPNILLSDPHQFSGDCMFIKHQDSKSLLCIPTLLMSQAWKGHSLGRNSVT